MCPIAGGNWNNSANAGVWAANFNNARSNSNDNVGFRADSASPRSAQAHGGTKGDGLPAATAAKSAGAAFLVGACAERQAATL